MIIGLMDCDYKAHSTKFPNLALMKLSAYHKARGDSVSMVDGGGDINRFDRIYASKVFTFMPDKKKALMPDPTQDLIMRDYRGELIKGGTGYSITAKLPEDVDAMFPDYSIYPHIKYAIGFLTRGCPNHCPWCVVPEKEGNICFYQAWQDIKRPDSNQIVFMDNNVLAFTPAIEDLKTMRGSGIKFDFNQGLDARLFNERAAELLGELKICIMRPKSGRFEKGIRFSCDNKSQMSFITRAVKLMEPYGYMPDDFYIYALLTDDRADSEYRLDFLRDLGVCVTAQPYRDLKSDNKIPQWQLDYARYTSIKSIWFSTPREEYGKRGQVSK